MGYERRPSFSSPTFSSCIHLQTRTQPSSLVSGDWTLRNRSKRCSIFDCHALSRPTHRANARIAFFFYFHPCAVPKCRPIYKSNCRVGPGLWIANIFKHSVCYTRDCSVCLLDCHHCLTYVEGFFNLVIRHLMNKIEMPRQTLGLPCAWDWYGGCHWQAEL